jgi:hypothetical protein
VGDLVKETAQNGYTNNFGDEYDDEEPPWARENVGNYRQEVAAVSVEDWLKDKYALASTTTSTTTVEKRAEPNQLTEKS